MSSDTGDAGAAFDEERFRELAEKAEENDLDPEEIEELREQYDALRELFKEIYDAIVAAVLPDLEQMRDAMRPLAEFCAEHPEVLEDSGVEKEERDAIEEIADMDQERDER